MTVGIPGAGIGGVFYLLSALLMPVREIGRFIQGRSSTISRQVVRRQFLIAIGILVCMWGTAWVLNVMMTIQPTLASISAAAHHPGTYQRLPRLLSYSAMALTFVTLIVVLGSVQIMRFVVPLRRVHGLVLTAVLVSAAIASAQDKPSESRAVFQQAQSLERTQPARSEMLYRRYIQLEPQDPWGYIVLAEFLGRNGRYQDALASMTKRRDARHPSETLSSGELACWDALEEPKRPLANWNRGPRHILMMRKHGRSYLANANGPAKLRAQQWRCSVLKS